MPTQRQPDDKQALLQGTLDLSILRTLVLGHATDKALPARSNKNRKAFLWWITDHSISHFNGWRAENGLAESGESLKINDERFYTLTPKGRAQLVHKTNPWHRIAKAVGRILAPGESEA